MMRFYDIQRGQVLIDGVDVREQDLTALRQHFGVVLQDPFLFTGTIADNIRLGTKWITDDADMERAAEEVNVARLHPHPAAWLQRAPARARRHPLHRPEAAHQLRPRPCPRPRILILDEATSSVDTDTEIRVRTALARMITGRTSVVIAHRLSTIQRADTILVMHKGQLREHGTHQQLLAHRGLYWKLYQPPVQGPGTRDRLRYRHHSACARHRLTLLSGLRDRPAGPIARIKHQRNALTAARLSGYR